MKNRLIVLAAGVFLTIGMPAMAKSVKIHGYVTNVVSSTVFEIEDYKITKDLTLVLDFEKGDTDEPIDFRPEDIRVGTELEISGDYNETTGELSAKSVKVFLEEHKKIKRTALIERTPQIDKSEDGWVGNFLADGQRIRVETSTKVLFKPNQSERKAIEEREKAERKIQGNQNKQRAEELPEEERYTRPLESLDQIGPNTFMSYEGYRQPDASITAVRVEFMRNEIEKGEANLWKKLTPKTKEPDYLTLKPGELNIPQVGKFKLVPSREAQDYVRQLGEKLIPSNQKTMQNGDPNKIPFQFYLVDSKDPNAFATPNGVVVVYSPMFDILQNEAQFAAVLGHEIAHSVQEHTYFQQQYHKKKLFAMSLGAAFLGGMGYGNMGDLINTIVAGIRNGYSRSLENQADRVGLEYMLEAGYDPREAPRVWKAMTQELGDRRTDFFWSNHDNNTTRRSYLMVELKNNYGGLDFDQLQKHAEAFQHMAQVVRDATQKKGKVTVKY